MKRRLVVQSILILMVIPVMVITNGCGGAPAVITPVHIPDLDQTQYNDSYYQEGWKRLQEGKPREAVKYFEQSTSVDEKLYVGFGYAYLAQNKVELARRNFDKVLAINPQNLQAQFGLASLYELLNEKKTAFQLYSKLRTLYPGNPWIKVRYDSIKAAETENYLKKAADFKIKNQVDDYIRALETASWYSPDMTDIKVEIADFFNSQQQYAKATQQYEKVLEILPRRQDLLMKAAELYEKMNRYDSALVLYRRMQELNPGDPSIGNKISDLKIKFQESNLPPKFKNIYFKNVINREELAALTGYYFEKYLETRPPVIITDIANSFAKEYIIKVCSLEIMTLKPDHSFDRFSEINRAGLAVVLNALLKYLEKSARGGYDLEFHPLEEALEPADISPLHKDYQTIKFLVNAGIIKLDEKNYFNPTQPVSPPEVLEAIKKILNSIPD